jgi:hypothetical protein
MHDRFRFGGKRIDSRDGSRKIRTLFQKEVAHLDALGGAGLRASV